MEGADLLSGIASASSALLMHTMDLDLDLSPSPMEETMGAVGAVSPKVAAAAAPHAAAQGLLQGSLSPHGPFALLDPGVPVPLDFLSVGQEGMRGEAFDGPGYADPEFFSVEGTHVELDDVMHF